MMKKRWLQIFLVLAVLGTGVLGMTHVLVEGRLYPRYAQTLDLRGETISLAHYHGLREKLPDCVILWDVPFQGNTYPWDTRSITVASLEHDEVALLDLFPALERVDARGCRDYAGLMALQERRPDCRVEYTVELDGREYPQDESSVVITSLTEEELERMQYLPELTHVDASGCRDYALLQALQERFPQCTLRYEVELQGVAYDPDTEELSLNQPDVGELAQRLHWLSRLKRVTLKDPQGDPGVFLNLMEKMPETEFVWEKNVLGITLRSTDTEMDFSGAETFTTEEIRDTLAWFPDVEQVFLGECGIDNEVLADFREQMRPDYKVVWVVRCGWLKVRTDEKGFMPAKYRFYKFMDEHAYNLRYCEDMEAVDVGHMNLHDISWAEHMPNLKYLILAHSTVTDLSPLSSCKNLEFLEIEFTWIKDYSPLTKCTGLRDLNMGRTYGDPTPLLELTWLNNLWCIECNPDTIRMLKENMPDSVHVNSLDLRTPANSWRMQENYYKLRDILGMPYLP